jgi:hypothetical protein
MLTADLKHDGGHQSPLGLDELMVTPVGTEKPGFLKESVDEAALAAFHLPLSQRSSSDIVSFDIKSLD